MTASCTGGKINTGEKLDFSIKDAREESFSIHLRGDHYPSNVNFIVNSISVEAM